MCAPAVFIAGMVLSAVATAASMQAASANAKAQNQALTYQQQVNDTEKALRDDDIKRGAARMAARQRATFAAYGVDLSGSPIDVLASTSADAQRDMYNNSLNNQLQNNSLEYEKRVVNMRARQQQTQSLLNFAASSLMRGASMGAGGAAAPAGSDYSGGVGTNPVSGLRYGGV